MMDIHSSFDPECIQVSTMHSTRVCCHCCPGQFPGNSHGNSVPWSQVREGQYNVTLSRNPVPGKKTQPEVLLATYARFKSLRPRPFGHHVIPVETSRRGVSGWQNRFFAPVSQIGIFWGHLQHSKPGNALVRDLRKRPTPACLQALLGRCSGCRSPQRAVGT